MRERNHFSHWLMARTEFALAQKLRPRKVSDFGTLENLRHDLIESIAEYRREQSQALIGEFNPATFQPAESSFCRSAAARWAARRADWRSSATSCCAARSMDAAFPAFALPCRRRWC